MAGVYADAATVRRYLNTTLSDTDIGLVVEDTDAEIDREIGPQDSNDKVIRRLAAFMTAYAIKTVRDPQSVIIGPFQARMNPLQALKDEIDRLKGMYGTQVAIV